MCKRQLVTTRSTSFDESLLEKFAEKQDRVKCYQKSCHIFFKKKLNPKAMNTYKRPTTIGQKLTNYKELALNETRKQTNGGSRPCGHCALCGCYGKNNKPMVPNVSQLLTKTKTFTLNQSLTWADFGIYVATCHLYTKHTRIHCYFCRTTKLSLWISVKINGITYLMRKSTFRTWSSPMWNNYHDALWCLTQSDVVFRFVR